jgi:SpoVK/Ycf46/Vps4 family AAA+-type ATPase
VSVGDEITWNICANTIKCTILAMDHSRSKIDRHNTSIHFDTTRQPIPFTIEEQKDIYLTSLADMIESSFVNSDAYRKLGIPVAKSILIRGVSGVGKTRLVK